MQPIYKNIVVVIIFLSCLQTYCFSQNQDSVVVVSKEWKTEKIKKGVIWKQGHFDNLYESQQEINIIEIDLRKNLKHLRIAGDSTLLKPTSSFSIENGALASVNGGFFNMRDGGAVNFIKIDGKTLKERDNSSSKSRSDGALYFSRKEILLGSINHQDEQKMPNAMVSGPLLLFENNVMPLASNPFNDNRHPRTALGITADNKLLLITIDGRNSKAFGMSLSELAKTMRWLNVRNGLNLDGGGSTTMYINEKGIVNYPSDNKKFDHEGERPVANIIYIK